MKHMSPGLPTDLSLQKDLPEQLIAAYQLNFGCHHPLRKKDSDLWHAPHNRVYFGLSTSEKSCEIQLPAQPNGLWVDTVYISEPCALGRIYRRRKDKSRNCYLIMFSFDTLEIPFIFDMSVYVKPTVNLDIRYNTVLSRPDFSKVLRTLKAGVSLSEILTMESI